MFESIIQPVAQWIINIISQMGYPGILLTMGIESACIPLPSEIIMPFSGSLVSGGRFSMLGFHLPAHLDAWLVRQRRMPPDIMAVELFLKNTASIYSFLRKKSMMPSDGQQNMAILPFSFPGFCR